MVVADGILAGPAPRRLRIGFRMAGVTVVGALVMFVAILVREELRAPRLAALTRSMAVLEHSIGFGGLIHSFKNYVLRPDEPVYEVRARQAAADTLAVLDAMMAEPILKEMGDEILQSRLAVAAYLDRLAAVRQMHAAGASARDIDAAVRYDDGPTLAALSRLRARVDEASAFHLDTSRRSSAALLILALLGSVCALQTMRAENRKSLQAAEKAQSALMRERAVNSELQAFSYAISHDLQAPLNTIQMMIEELRDGAGRDRLDADQKALLRHGLETVGRVKDQIEDLMAYAGMVADASAVEEPIDLAGKFAVICEDLRADIAATGAEVTIGALPVIQCNRSQMRTLGQNLVSNAIKYRRTDVPPRIAITSETDSLSGWIRIHVADNGIGIAPEHQGRIFEMFKRLHRQDQIPGSGLGLTICRRVAVKLGGDLTVASHPGEGSTFTLHLPPERILA